MRITPLSLDCDAPGVICDPMSSGPLIPWLGSLPGGLGEIIVYVLGGALAYLLARWYKPWAAAGLGTMATFTVIVGAGLGFWPLFAPVAVGVFVWWMGRGCFPGGDSTKEEPQK